MKTKTLSRTASRIGASVWSNGSARRTCRRDGAPEPDLPEDGIGRQRDAAFGVERERDVVDRQLERRLDHAVVGLEEVVDVRTGRRVAVELDRPDGDEPAVGADPLGQDAALVLARRPADRQLAHVRGRLEQRRPGRARCRARPGTAGP